MNFKLFLFTVMLMFLGTTVFSASSKSILVDITPPNPAPLENTTITLSSYVNNLDSVLITWFTNGKKASSGIGKKSFSLNAPAQGSEITVIAAVALPDGEVETSVIIRPAPLVLLWQANDSYVPPFYKGKALPVLDSEIKVVAMSEIKGIDPKNMTYAWKKDYENEAGGSGYGKNFFTYSSDYLEKSHNISVSASTIDQKYSSEASIDIGSVEPKILFYKNDLNLGTIWEKALTNPHNVSGSEFIEAAPYFISPKEIQNPRLVWGWYINDNMINVSSLKKNLMPLQAQSGVSGRSKLKLIIENMDKIFQTASKEISIGF